MEITLGVTNPGMSATHLHGHFKSVNKISAAALSEKDERYTPAPYLDHHLQHFS